MQQEREALMMGNELWLLSVTLCLSVLGYLLINLFHTYVLRPAMLTRALREQGFKVLPFKPMAGDVGVMKRMESSSQGLDMPSPSHHHLLFSHLFPFHHKHLSDNSDPYVYWWGTQPNIMLFHPEDAKLALSADVKHFMKPEFVMKVFLNLLGKGLLLANGDDWENQRTILQPAFFPSKLKEMVASMYTITLEMVKDWENQIGQQGCREIEVAKDIKDTAADILACTSFGTSYLEGKSVFEKQTQLLILTTKLQVQNSVIPGYRYLPTRSNRLLKELERSVNQGLYEIVELRRSKIHKEGGAAYSYGSDLLGLILAAENDEIKKDSQHISLTNQQVIDECKNFFFAGHETTANLLAWTMVLLSLNQNWQDKAREEVLEVCGKGEVKADHLSKLKIVGMVLNESLRLYPPVSEYGRRVLCPNEKGFKLGYRTLPKGSGFTISCLYIHRRKDIWGEDADEFRPERFINGAVKACNHPFGFLPFGIGPRACIGQQFAIFEAKVIMAAILSRFVFRLSPSYRHAPAIAVTMRPQHGVQLIIEKFQ